jgi:hypothetical protein
LHSDFALTSWRPHKGIAAEAASAQGIKKPANLPVFLLFDFRFLVDHVLASLRIVLLGLHLFRVQAFVLARGVEVAGTGARNQPDFLSVGSHPLILPVLWALTLRAQVGEYFVDAVLVDDAQTLVGHAQPNVALLGFDPETLGLQVRQEPPAGFVMGMGNVIAALRAFPCDLADLRHGVKFLILRKVAREPRAKSVTLYQPAFR